MRNHNDIIELELDPDEIKILKEGGGVCKETDNSDLPVLFIYKWDVIRELQDDMEGEEGLVDVFYEPDGAINEKRKKYKLGEGCLEGTVR